jgi:hypothetical protein
MMDPSGKPCLLKMKKDMNRWIFKNSEDLPPWCLSIETQLSDAIEEHLTGTAPE